MRRRGDCEPKCRALRQAESDVPAMMQLALAGICACASCHTGESMCVPPAIAGSAPTARDACGRTVASQMEQLLGPAVPFQVEQLGLRQGRNLDADWPRARLHDSDGLRKLPSDNCQPCAIGNTKATRTSSLRHFCRRVARLHSRLDMLLRAVGRRTSPTSKLSSHNGRRARVHLRRLGTPFNNKINEQKPRSAANQPGFITIPPWPRSSLRAALQTWPARAASSPPHDAARPRAGPARVPHPTAAAPH